MNKVAVGVAVGVLIVLLLAIGGWYLLANRKSETSLQPTPDTSQSATISGHVDLNGLVLPGAVLALGVKEHGSKEEYKIFNNSLEAKDKVTWEYKDAKSGMSYELQAYIMKDGKTLDTSDPIYVTAPATDEVISINVESAVKASADAVISGILDLNGYIPANATVSMESRKSGETAFDKIVDKLPAKDGQLITYSSAITGQDYDIRATLFDTSGKQIGQTKTFVITAPAYNEHLVINSTSIAPTPTRAAGEATTPPAAGSTISGKINLNGAAPKNSSLVILASETGKNNFQVVVNGVTVSDKASWVWNSAKSSVTYDLVAVLKQQNDNGTQTDVAKSQTITVASPASNEILTLNTGFSLPGPTGTMSISCGTKDGNNNWPASISFQSVDGAASYWFQTGTNNGGSDIYNSTQNATNNSSQTINVTLKDSVNYYTRYAFANIQNATNNQFSPFSYVATLKCPK